MSSDKATSKGHNYSEGSHLDRHFRSMMPEYEEMLQDSGLQSGQTVLDAGAGSGGFVPLMAELVGENGSIHALELAPENVELIKELVRTSSFSCEVIAKEGSLFELPYEDDCFDLVWCANVSAYLTDEELSRALAEFVRVSRKGGKIVVREIDMDCMRVYGPLNPMLFRRIVDAISGRPYISGVLRTSNLPKWFREAGLQSITYKTYLGERRQPLDSATEALLRAGFGGWYKIAESLELPEEDLRHWRRAKDKDAADSLLKDPDFYFREGWGLVTGIVT